MLSPQIEELRKKYKDNILNYDENKSSFKTWLTAITRNILISLIQSLIS